MLSNIKKSEVQGYYKKGSLQLKNGSKLCSSSAQRNQGGKNSNRQALKLYLDQCVDERFLASESDQRGSAPIIRVHTGEQ